MVIYTIKSKLCIDFTQKQTKNGFYRKKISPLIKVEYGLWTSKFNLGKLSKPVSTLHIPRHLELVHQVIILWIEIIGNQKKRKNQ